MDALLVIDMQAGSFSSAVRFDADGVVERINILSESFRKRGLPVIFVRHDGTRENFLVHGTEDWELLPSLVRREGDLYVEKTANDSFYRTELDGMLREKGVDELYVCGCATDFCVNATIHSALVRDFNVTVVSDCHTTADRPAAKAETLIAFHNWLWESLTPTEGRIRTVPLSSLIPLSENRTPCRSSSERDR